MLFFPDATLRLLPAAEQQLSLILQRKTVECGLSGRWHLFNLLVAIESD